MHTKNALQIFFTSLLLSIPTLSQTVDGSEYNNSTAGPPSSAAAKASQTAKYATHPVSRSSGATKVTIHSDWSNFTEGTAFVLVADMDVDCDGIDYRCKKNQDGQPQTNFGALAAYEVPWIVIPDKFGTQYRSVLPGNNIAAVICDGKMFYGIYGDSDGDDPEVIGEVSWLMTRTCFPNDNLDGSNGHTGLDVAYILFTGNNTVLPSSALNKNYITNFTTLRSMCDKLIGGRMKNLGNTSAPSTTPRTERSSSSSTPSCSWERHWAGRLKIAGIILFIFGMARII
ncbi:uncharacterized protein N7483_008380 [Penicillium malachiteum]|uniref:uncharacterized protein n=1 Tax=Penicillium malachiteum TaxID=1324776 RepID=UPI00254842A6|nr:uncharacterized protein N7483_008380 [Penicillium malachiteum]KAJ5720446.1 hypothetical protein N7483_008380 [Penicillium malachiteum]